MSNIVTFETKHSTFSGTAKIGPAEIIIFPGVRYERSLSTSDSSDDGAPKCGKNTSSRKRRRAT